jgi:hypothetical protein
MPIITLDGDDALFDSSKVENNSGVLSLKLQNNPGQDFTQEFTNDTGFTYDSNFTEFTGGQCQQKDQTPSNAQSWATYETTVNLTSGGGVLTGTPVGGASITGNRLDLAQNDLRYVDYDATANADSQQTGAIRFKLTPNYSGSPASSQIIFRIDKAAGDTDNNILIFHTSGGNLSIRILGSAGGGIVDAALGVWSPTALTTYELELNYDITSGATRLFVDGTQFGTTQTGTGTRDSNIGLIRIGSDTLGVSTSNFFMEDLIIFDAVQHTGNYTPGYTLPVAKYVTDIVTLPEMEYTGAGTLISFDTFTTTEGGSPRYTLQIGRSGNYLYWTGTMWTTSDNTYAQANDVTTFNANVASLPVNGEIYGQFRMYWDDSSTQSSCDELTASLTAQTYPTDDPLVTFQTTIRTDGYTSFAESSSKSGSDEIKYTLSKNGTQYYVPSNVWTVSDGSYSQMSDATDIDADAATFTTTATTSTIRARLHSETGATTPSLTSITVEYSFAGEAQDTLDTCVVYGYSTSPDGSINTDSITITLNQDAVKYKTNTVLQKTSVTVTPESTTGYWEAEIVENDNMDGTARYIFDFGDRSYSAKVPDEASKRFWDLEELQVVE